MHPRDDEQSLPEGWIREHTKIGPVREVKVTNHLEQQGIEGQGESLKTDGSLSWVVVSKGFNKYVVELHEKMKNIHYDEMATGMENKEQPSPPSHSFSNLLAPNDQRKWNATPATDYVRKRSLSYRVS